MGHRAIVANLLLPLICLSICACSHQGVSTSELKGLRTVAFEEATKRYVLTDAVIEARYKKEAAPVVQGKPNEPSSNYFDHLIDGAAREMVRIKAVASIRGVKLSPSNQANVYFVKFDFEPSKNPHAELPENKATAERFERPDGTRYWVIEW